MVRKTSRAPASAGRPRRKRKTRSSRPSARRTSTRRYWSRQVTERSNALDLDKGVFQMRTARQVAQSLKRSAEHSRRRKSSPFRSAMSMLNFYINRAGRGLSQERKRVLNRAKEELRALFASKAS